MQQNKDKKVEIVKCKAVVLDSLNYGMVPEDRKFSVGRGWGHVITFRERLTDMVGLKIKKDNTHYTMGVLSILSHELVARHNIALDKLSEAPRDYLESNGFKVRKAGYEDIITREGNTNWSLATKDLTGGAEKVYWLLHKEEITANG